MSVDESAPFDPRNPPKRAITADVVVFTVVDGNLWVVLQRRGYGADEPFPGLRSLPGAFVGDEEELLETAQRVLRDKVGLTVDARHLTRSGVHDLPDRDPRMRTISVAFVVLIAEHDHRTFLDTARNQGQLHQVSKLIEPAGDSPIIDQEEPMAFDHLDILTEAREHARVLLEETDAALDLLPPVFTLTQLREIYDAVWGATLNPGNFIKRVTRIEGFIEQVQPDGNSEAGFPSSPLESAPEWVVYESVPELTAESASAAILRSSPSRRPGRPPRHFTSAGSAKLHPPLRRPGSYFSRPTSQG